MSDRKPTPGRGARRLRRLGTLVAGGDGASGEGALRRSPRAPRPRSPRRTGTPISCSCAPSFSPTADGSRPRRPSVRSFAVGRAAAPARTTCWRSAARAPATRGGCPERSWPPTSIPSSRCRASTSGCSRGAAGDMRAAQRELEQALVLLAREDASRILLFGGGFAREALTRLCRAELRGRRGHVSAREAGPVRRGARSCAGVSTTSSRRRRRARRGDLEPFSTLRIAGDGYALRVRDAGLAAARKIVPTPGRRRPRCSASPASAGPWSRCSACACSWGTRQGDEPRSLVRPLRSARIRWRWPSPTSRGTCELPGPSPRRRATGRAHVRQLLQAGGALRGVIDLASVDRRSEERSAAARPIKER